MKIIAVDGDREALTGLKRSLESVFSEAEVISFDNALDSYQYYAAHKREIALIFFPLVLKPFDGFRYAEIVKQPGFRGSVVFTTQTDNDEIRELIQLNGDNWYIAKPVTPEKTRKLAALEQELCLDRIGENAGEKCVGCVYHWCKNRRP